MSDATYKLDELARAAGTSPRTVRYYVRRGLLPSPAFRGRDTTYGEEHLVRLRAIRRFQEAFFPLDAIAVELSRRSLAELERIASGAEVPSPFELRMASFRPGAPPSTSPRPMNETATSNVSERLFRRIELAPGVELSVAEDAPMEARRVAERILRDFEIK
jgi:Ca-activated chloride channel family protein